MSNLNLLQKYESFLMKCARFFGSIIMTAVLIMIIAAIAVVSFNKISELAKSKYPVVIFQNDIISSDSSGSPVFISEDAKFEASLVKEVMTVISPMYRVAVEQYIGPDKINNAGMTIKIENAIKSFDERSEEFLLSKISDRDLKDSDGKRNYTEQLISYLKNASQANVEVVSNNKFPVYSIADSKEYRKFHSEYWKQRSEIEKSNSKNAGWEGMLQNGAVYLGGFSLIMIFLVLAMMFSIIRIENKIGISKE